MTKRSPAQYDWDDLEFRRLMLRKHYSSIGVMDKRYTVAHHMTIKGTGDGAALDKCYDVWQNREASAQYGVDGQHVGQYVWDKDYAWATGSTAGNLYGISVEHANSSLAPKWEISTETLATGAKLTAHIHKKYKLGRPTSTGGGKGGTMRTHSSFFATACPGPYFKTVWDEYVATTQKIYDEITGAKPVEPTPPKPKPKNEALWGKPETWKIGATGADVTELGERIVVWSKALGLPKPYKVGPGEPFSETDRAALSRLQVAWGYGSSRKDLAKGGNSDGFPGLQTFAMLAQDPPTSTTYTIATWNLKSPTLIGKWLAWPLRRGGQRDIIKAIKPDVLLAQEVGPPSKERWYTTALGALGLTNAKTHNAAGSGKWRAAFFNAKSFTHVAAGLYTIGPRQGSDTKEMGEVVLEDEGRERWYFGSLHLENEDGAKNDRLRVDQIEDCFRRAAARAGLYGVKPEHVILGGDTNSQNMVRQWVERNTDYRDAAKQAKTAKHVDIRSINGWLPFRRGARQDYLFVHKGLTVATFTQVDGHKVSDHNPQIITISN